jgi:hypothetical protein
MTSCRQVCERVLELKKQRPHTRASDVSVDFEFQSLVAVAAPKLAEALLIALDGLAAAVIYADEAGRSKKVKEALAAIDKIFGKAE